MENSYALVCKEVSTVLRQVPDNQRKVIPYHIIRHLEDVSKDIKEDMEIKFDIYGNPILSNEAKSMIVLIYQKYFLNDELRNLLTQKLYENNKK